MTWSERSFSELYLEPSRNGLSVARADRGPGTPMLGMGELFANRRLSWVSEIETVPDPGPRWLLRRNDLLFGRRSLTLSGAGKCSIVKEFHEDVTFESSLIRVRLDERHACADFYHYYFMSRPGRQRMATIVEQTAVAGIRSSDLGRLRVPIPPLDEQRRIAEVLGALDDLIDTNERLAMDLRALQAAIVSDAQTRSSREVAFGEVASLHRVKSLGGPETPYLGLEHFAVNGKGIVSAGRLGAVSSGQQSFSRGDLLYGRLRPYFRKVDRPGFDGACSGEVWVIRPTEAVPSCVLGAIISAQEFTDFAMAGSEGTKMPRAKWDHVARYTVRLPEESELARIVGPLESMWLQIVALAEENASLRRTRDELLPILMSGKVRVRPVEDAA